MRIRRGKNDWKKIEDGDRWMEQHQQISLSLSLSLSLLSPLWESFFSGRITVLTPGIAELRSRKLVPCYLGLCIYLFYLFIHFIYLFYSCVHYVLFTCIYLLFNSFNWLTIQFITPVFIVRVICHFCIPTLVFSWPQETSRPNKYNQSINQSLFGAAGFLCRALVVYARCLTKYNTHSYCFFFRSVRLSR